MTTVLHTTELCKTYTDAGHSITVLDKVNFSVQKGEMVAIVGASGAGKTTLLQVLGGLDKPTSGTVFVNGENLTELNERKKGELRNRSLGFVYQFHHLLPEFNAFENVCIPLLIRGLPPKQVEEKALYYVEHVGLKDRLTHRIGELSGGERQRIALARALVTEPKCVLADEPTGNLDEKTAEHVAELILELNQRLKTSFVIVTHNRRLANKMHRTLVLDRGQLQLEETKL